MTTKRILNPRADGGVRRTTPVTERRAEESESEFLARIGEHAVRQQFSVQFHLMPDGTLRSETLSEHRLRCWSQHNVIEPGETEVEAEARIKATLPAAWGPQSLDPAEIERFVQTEIAAQVVLDDAELPSKRWRYAWKLSGGSVVIDIPRARKQRRSELLRMCEDRLAALDKDIRVAQYAEDKVKEKAARDRGKAILRLEAALDARLAQIQTPEELAAFVPTELQ